MPNSSIIISVYRDTDALSLILAALHRQSQQEFEIIISEDGNDRNMANFIENVACKFPLLHLTQPDEGFRKNRALNRAIAAASSDWLIFLDGDCVPHDNFVAAHTAYAGQGIVTAGRRIELGQQWTTWLRQNPEQLRTLNHYHWWWTHIRSLSRDNIKGIELMLMPRFAAPLFNKRTINLLGCNFAAHRRDLISINGFDEEYCAAGIGEDSDIDWRLRRQNVKIVNVKFSALQWHLYHPRHYSSSKENQMRLQRNQTADRVRPIHGIDTHFKSVRVRSL